MVLCLLDHWKTHECLVMLALGLVNVADFPTNLEDYCHAIQFLVATGKIDIVIRNVTVLRISNSPVNLLFSKPRTCILAFHMAAAPLSAFSPWLNTHCTITYVEHVHLQPAHQDTLPRFICLDPELCGLGKE